MMRETIIREFAELRPSGGYKVILADPPWEFDNWSSKGTTRGAAAHYPCMPTPEIAALPVELLAADDCVLFFWVTWPKMEDWAHVMKSWGFTFKGLAWEWVKFNPETGKHAFGMGYGTRKNLEPCLIATRGNPAAKKDVERNLFGDREKAEGVRSVRDFIYEWPGEALRAPRREHSRKPEEPYARIETLFDGPYIELFARQSRPSWTAWGNQTDKFEFQEHAAD